MTGYDYFIAYIFINKILFVLFGIWHFILVREKKGDSVLAQRLAYWKERCEFIFIVCMALLCFYLFNPFLSKGVELNKETRLLLFIFGIIIFITSDWSLFFEQAPWFSRLQYFIGGKINGGKNDMNHGFYFLL